MKRIEIKKELLEEMYMNKGMSLRDIGNELGCSMQTVSRRLNEYGIEIRTSKDGKATNYYKDKIVEFHDSMKRDDVRKCEYCKNEFAVKPHMSNKYCSLNCYHEHRSLESKTETKCDNCGIIYYRPNNYPTSKNTFCSTSCAGDWKSRYLVGLNSHTWSRVETKCGNCGKTIFVKPSSYNNYTYNYCDKTCMSEHYKVTLRGKNNPNWTGGKINYYGPNWLESRRKVRSRDNYKCQRCGVLESELDTELTVHHIKLFRHCKDYKEANQLNNLISLCSKCHTYVHSNSNTNKDFLKY